MRWGVSGPCGAESFIQQRTDDRCAAQGQIRLRRLEPRQVGIEATPQFSGYPHGDDLCLRGTLRRGAPAPGYGQGGRRLGHTRFLRALQSACEEAGALHQHKARSAVTSTRSCRQRYGIAA
jgi:hypothetical protein